MRFNTERIFLQLGLLFCVGGILACSNSGSAIEEGSYVRVHYSLEANGQVVVSGEKPEEMHLVVGQAAYPQAYETALIGMREGDRKDIRLEPENAFGPIRPELFVRIPRAQLPEGLQEGAIIGANDKSGRPVSMRVMKILDDSVVVDQNHPLAGRTLTYHIEIVEIS